MKQPSAKVPYEKGPIVESWTEFGHQFEIEKLVRPRQIGASMRFYRLYDNGEPAYGNQWHACLSYAKAHASYILQQDYVTRITWLEQRVNNLERELLEAQNG
jgi:hypothetical protein